LACAIVLTHARSAAYIGCSSSIASGRPAGRVFEQLADPVADHSRADDVLRHDAAPILGQTADDEHEARRAERERFVDGAPVVVVRHNLATLAIAGEELPPRQ
jgi:hypothetical protein